MKRRKHKGIYILPNLLTSISLFAGFYAIIASINLKFSHAAYAVFVSGIFDMLDGRVARLTGSTSRFGVEFDSLSDAIAFGVAPGILVYMWALKGYGRFGWLAAFLFVACGALRLARFNVQADNGQKRSFLGLPIPAAATTIAGCVLFYSWLGYSDGIKTVFMPILVYLLALLMVSDIRYYSFKDMSFFRGRHSMFCQDRSIRSLRKRRLFLRMLPARKKIKQGQMVFYKTMFRNFFIFVGNELHT